MQSDEESYNRSDLVVFPAEISKSRANEEETHG